MSAAEAVTTGPLGDEIVFVYVQAAADGTGEVARRARRAGAPDGYEVARRKVNSHLGILWTISGELTAEQFAEFRATGRLPAGDGWRSPRRAGSPYAQPCEAAYADHG